MYSWAMMTGSACWSEFTYFGRWWTGGQGKWNVNGSMEVIMKYKILMAGYVHKRASTMK